jgi:serralysin
VFVSLMHGRGDGGDAKGDVLVNIENLTGSGFADTLWGDNGDNVLEGLDGNDTLNGFGGTDHLLGGNGIDHLYGMAGADVLTGGSGADIFHFEATTETTFAAPDQITDFYENGGDQIDLSAIDANTTLAGDQAFLWIGNNNDFYVDADSRGQLRLNGNYVEGDVNGDLIADFRIQTNVTELHDYGFAL